MHEYFFIGLTSVALTLLFDTPFQNIKKIIFNNVPVRSKPLDMQKGDQSITVQTKKRAENKVFREKCL